MAEYVFKFLLYMSMFTISMYALSIIDFRKITKGIHPYKIQLLVILLAMSLSYLASNFLLNIIYKIN
ncbi:DUF1146 domain-containing protein [Erysipelotrichaceae bacterium OH741_COT-311]|nr:DUF1146 domain-containing protein [Erysipelotrichaceae bacterium]MDO5085114.1 DUF1146 domain-containing protein [Erysipelotrichaceae bacterium]RRC91331.1 DUF1146 domain-containing protein [Erysipelotrichaceae bacterium OH741_COT-311]